MISQIMEQNPQQRFVALYEAHRVSVFHTSFSLLKNYAAAEDVTQEVFLTLYRAISEENNIRNIRAWILSATRNRCLNFIRDNRYELCEEEFPIPDAISMEDEVMGRVLKSHLFQCVSEDESLIFTLHCLDGYKYREIAKALDIPMGTVQTKCRAARRKLKSALREI